MSTVLIVAAHSDDEALGCGGTIARHVLIGDTVFAISFTDGIGAREGSDDYAIAARESAAKESARILGFSWYAAGSFPDNMLDDVPLLDIVRFIESAKSAVTPDIVYTHSAADLNIDHRKVCEAVLTAFRPQPGEYCREIRCFEIASATDFGHESVTGAFRPNLFINIKETWPKKLQALKVYSGEMRAAPHIRSVEGLAALAQLRGMQTGLEMAEAFEVLRRVEI